MQQKQTILEVNNLDVYFKKDNYNILKNVNLEIESGDVVAFLGDNGAGKSTFLRLIAHDFHNLKISGHVNYLGTDIVNLGKKQIQSYRAQISYIPQEDDYSGFVNATVEDVLLDNAEACGLEYTKKDVQQLFDEYNLRQTDNKNKLIFSEKSNPTELSGGQKRMLSIISELFIRKNSKLFIIDEPLNNLDIKNVKWVSNLINQIHKNNPESAILLITHCRIFPFITRALEIKNNMIIESKEPFICNVCFGKPNNDGFYE